MVFTIFTINSLLQQIRNLLLKEAATANVFTLNFNFHFNHKSFPLKHCHIQYLNYKIEIVSLLIYIS